MDTPQTQQQTQRDALESTRRTRGRSLSRRSRRLAAVEPLEPVEPIEPLASLNARELRAWRAFLRAHVLVTRQLEADLLAAGGPQLAEYDVLVQLALAEGHALRMHELADRVVLSRAGITRLVDRLVAEGLVERQKCGLDGRGAFAVLTAAGLNRLRHAAPWHLGSVKRYFVDAFDEAELERLAELLERPVERAQRRQARAEARRAREEDPQERG